MQDVFFLILKDVNVIFSSQQSPWTVAKQVVVARQHASGNFWAGVFSLEP